MRSLVRSDLKPGPNNLKPALYPRALVFHKVQRNFSWGTTNFPPQRFFQLISDLRDRGYSFAYPWEEGHSEDVLALTFDDGYAHLTEILPRLVELRIPCTVFMPTALLGRENRWDYSSFFSPVRHLNRGEIAQLSAIGVEFGSHSHEHLDLTSLNPIEVKQELQRSQSTLSNIVGCTARAISYPFGRSNPSVCRIVEQSGFTFGFSMRFPAPGDSRLSLGRIAIYGFDTLLSVRAKLADSPLQAVEAAKAWTANTLSGGTLLLNRLRRPAR